MPDRRRIALLPVYNEEAALRESLDALLGQVHLFIIINDGSNDGTADILEGWAKEKEYVSLITFDENWGKARALLEGFKKIEELTAAGVVDEKDLIIITDADGQIPHDIIAEACRRFMSDDLDMLIGSRDFSLYTPLKRMGNTLFSQIARLLTAFPFRDSLCGFRIFTVGGMHRILPFYRPRRYACEQALTIIAALLKMSIDNTFPVKTTYFRSNPTVVDGLEILIESLRSWHAVKSGKKKAPGEKASDG